MPLQYNIGMKVVGQYPWFYHIHHEAFFQELPKPCAQEEVVLYPQ